MQRRVVSIDLGTKNLGIWRGTLTVSRGTLTGEGLTATLKEGNQKRSVLAKTDSWDLINIYEGLPSHIDPERIEGKVEAMATRVLPSRVREWCIGGVELVLLETQLTNGSFGGYAKSAGNVTMKVLSHVIQTCILLEKAKYQWPVQVVFVSGSSTIPLCFDFLQKGIWPNLYPKPESKKMPKKDKKLMTVRVVQAWVNACGFYQSMYEKFDKKRDDAADALMQAVAYMVKQKLPRVKAKELRSMLGVSGHTMAELLSMHDDMVVQQWINDVRMEEVEKSDNVTMKEVDVGSNSVTMEQAVDDSTDSAVKGENVVL